ncbi:MAG: aldehyde dehydrogenase [Planctomycetes bacterium]|nr:aldehyde dehydrogenase [Planctomycetota bacterium]
MREIVSFDPATREELGRVLAADAAEVERKVASLGKELPAPPLEERVALVRRAAASLRAQAASLAELMTREQGKPLRESRAEVDNAADRLDYFCGTAPRALAPIEETLPAFRSATRFRPIGVVAAIKPWNFPVGIPLWTIGPALLAGNAVLFKPSERTPLLGQRIYEIFREAPIEIVHGADETGRAIVRSNVDMISFVGSQAVGKEIMRESAPRLRRLTLELGGKDPMIVCADADLDAAVAGAVAATFKNCGQVCCGVQRIYVEKPLFGSFLAGVVERTKKLKVGNGLDPATDVGPMNREEQIETVERHLRDAAAKGARIVTGGRALGGLFFEPTVIAGIREEMLLAQEETFGPVMPVTAVADDEEAVRLANATDFGLTATVWTRDLERADRIARRLQAGTIGVNQTVGSVVQCPWGGVKRSGIGRMLGPEAAREFADVVNYRLPRAQ